MRFDMSKAAPFAVTQWTNCTYIDFHLLYLPPATIHSYLHVDLLTFAVTSICNYFNLHLLGTRTCAHYESNLLGFVVIRSCTHLNAHLLNKIFSTQEAEPDLGVLSTVYWSWVAHTYQMAWGGGGRKAGTTTTASI